MTTIRTKLTSYEPNIAGYEVKVTATCNAYEGGSYVERIRFYHVNFGKTPTHEDLLQQAIECLGDFKEEWLATKDNLEKDFRDYYYVLTSTISAGFGYQTVAFKEVKIYE